MATRRHTYYRLDGTITRRTTTRIAGHTYTISEQIDPENSLHTQATAPPPPTPLHPRTRHTTLRRRRRTPPAHLAARHGTPRPLGTPRPAATPPHLPAGTPLKAAPP